MTEELIEEILTLPELPFSKIKEKYGNLLEEEKSNLNNKAAVLRVIAYKLQESVLGGLSNEAERRIHSLVESNGGLKTISFKKNSQPCSSRDSRIPLPGTILQKDYKGKMIEVRILEKGFEFENRNYRSLTAIAKEVTGAHWNGYTFFGL